MYGGKIGGNKNRYASIVAILVLAGSLSSCTHVPKKDSFLPFGMRAVNAPEVAIEDFRDVPPAPSEQSAQWWQKFADATLTELVRDAQSENIGLQIANARLREARARGLATVAGYAPRLDIGGSVSETRRTAGDGLENIYGQPVNSQSTANSYARASWEVPLFGRLGASVAGARANTELGEIGVEAAKIAMISDIAAAYIDLRAAQTRQIYLQEDLARSEVLSQIATERLRVGLISRSDASFAATQESGTRIALADATLRVRANLDRLAILRGVTPGSLDSRMALTSADYAFRANAPQIDAIPANFVRRRLDVKQAERNAILASANVGINRAQLYPNLSISGTISLVAALAGAPLGSAVGRSVVTPSVTLPLFDFGQRWAAIRVANSQFDVAMLNYKATTLSAIAEGQAALSGYDQGLIRANAASASESAARTRVLAAREAFRVGLISMKDNIEAESDFASARQARLSAQAQLSDSAIGLYRTFAGSPEIID
jgi:NodT family efflux transporter outer membrane factor (OMF) lipoprotein